MSKLSKANYILGILFIISFIASIGNDIKAVERYGWIYDKTTIIGNDISTETINMNIVYYNYVFMGILIIVLTKNGRSVNGSIVMDSSGIEDFEFPKGKPKDWHVDIADTFVGVTLNEYEILLPRHKIELSEETD